MEAIINLIVICLGLSIGSFVNMLEYRTAVKYKLRMKRFPSSKTKTTPSGDLSGRSICDFCGKQMSWYENVPVLSWFIQGGKSRCCKKPLPYQYPIVEIFSALFLTYMANRFNIITEEFGVLNIFQLIFAMVLTAMLVFAAVFDLKYMILPDFSTAILAGIALFGVLFDEPNPLPYIVTAAGACGFLLLIHVITKGKGMGMGDVKYAVFMGLFLGWQKTIVAFYIAFIAGAIIGIVLLMLRKVKGKGQIAFGPFLIAGTVAAWWWGEVIIKYVTPFL